MSWSPELIETARQSLGGDYLAISSSIRAKLTDPPSGPLFDLVRAVDYMLVDRPERAAPPDRVYVPQAEWRDRGTYPEPLSAATDATLASWAEAFDAFRDSPALAARLGDMLWLRRYGTRPDLFARAANTALRSLRRDLTFHEVERAEFLQRASAIALELNDAELVRATTDEALAEAAAALRSDDKAPGVELRLIDAAARSRDATTQAKVDELLELATTKYQEDPFISSDILQTRSSRAGHDSAKKDGLARLAINSWESAADREPGLRGQTYLERALEVAANAGLTSELDRLRVKYQQAAPATEDLEAISVEIPIPREQVDAYLSAFIVEGDPVRSITRFASRCPVSADRDQVHQQVRELMDAHPLQYLFPRVVLNDEQLPLRTITGDDEQFVYAVTSQDARGIAVWAVFAIDILARLQSGGHLASDHVVAYLGGSVVEEAGIEDVVVRAVDHYLAGRFDDSAFVLLPRLEAVLRHAAGRVGLATFVEPGARKNGVGAYLLLPELLAGLEGLVPEDHRIYLRTLLVEQLGTNLRNRALHGLVREASQQDAALVIHAAFLLGGWRLQAGGPEPSVSSAREDDADSRAGLDGPG